MLRLHLPTPFFAFSPLLLSFLPLDVVAGVGLILAKQSFKISSKPSFLLASNMTSSVAIVVRLACLFFKKKILGWLLCKEKFTLIFFNSTTQRSKRFTY